MNDITRILQSIPDGESLSAEQLVPLVYDELRNLAACKMSHERADLTLNPTALVHEAWLRVAGNNHATWQNRAHFFGAAAEAMRRILIDRARRRLATKHGGGLNRVPVEDLDRIHSAESDDRLLAVHEALGALAVDHPQKAELVKLRYFAGMTIEEAANTMNISEPTAKRWWTFARAWLFQEIKS